MYNPTTTTWTTTNNSIIESKIIKARDIEALTERVNEYINGRAAKCGDIQEFEGWLLMAVDILSVQFNYNYIPIQIETPKPIKWVLKDNINTYRDVNIFLKTTISDDNGNITTYNDKLENNNFNGHCIN